MSDSSDVSAILDRLVAEGLINTPTRNKFATSSQGDHESIEDLLLRDINIPENSLLPLVAKALELPYFVEVEPSQIDKVAIKKVGIDFFLARNILPAKLSESDPSMLVSARPTKRATIAEIRFFLGTDVPIAIAPTAAIRECLRGFQAGSRTEKADDVSAPPGETLSTETLSAAARELDEILSDGIECRASDIHFEVRQSGLCIRMRVDGVLREHPAPQGTLGEAMVSRLKLLGGMNVTERRLPQDGSCRRKIRGKKIELRLSTVPTQFGESLVCRLMDPTRYRHGLMDLGYPKEIAQDLVTLLSRPSGLLVISGPTGSGKTTTLYAALQHLNDGRRKILTVEDPIEQTIDGVDQVQAHPAIGLTFATVLRSVLRQDPDVIMVGEIRDEETAEIACRAALVGRLVLATVHASSAEGVKTRLIDLGVPRYLVDDVLIAAVHQRLEQSGCKSCHGKGCTICGGTGVVGRTLKAELVSS